GWFHPNPNHGLSAIICSAPSYAATRFRHEKSFAFATEYARRPTAHSVSRNAQYPSTANDPHTTATATHRLRPFRFSAFSVSAFAPSAFPLPISAFCFLL